MSSIDDATASERRSGHRRLIALVAFGTPAALLFSLTMVLVVAMNDQVLVSNKAGLKSVDLGWPLVWIRQDQSASDPPFPTRAGVLSPWENPMRLSLDAFLVDALAVFVAVSIGALLVSALLAALVRRRRVNQSSV